MKELCDRSMYLSLSYSVTGRINRFIVVRHPLLLFFRSYTEFTDIHI